jgi:hypothetical protein
MTKSDSWENKLLLLLFNNSDTGDIGDVTGLRGSSTAGSLYISLHTADPGEAGSQTTNEAAYTSYARVGVARSGSGWTVTANAVENAAAITFPQATGGSETITHFGVGTDSTGAGVLLYKGSLTSSLAVSSGVTPEIEAGDLDITEA